MNLTLEKIYSEDVESYLEELAKIRIEVFKEFPYLYQGTLEYEKKYLSRYIKAKDSMIVLAKDSEKVIGASTCIPLIQEDDDFVTPLKQAGYNINNAFYFGESIILKNYRGQKIGHQFFKYREEHAKEVFPNLRFTCFCSVVRENHDLEPRNYKPLDQFWMRVGYTKAQSLKTQYAWQDIDKNHEDLKDLVYWIKEWP